MAIQAVPTHELALSQSISGLKQTVSLNYVKTQL